MKKSLILVSLLIAILAFPAADPAAARTGLKVFISVDMEGICGVVHGDQTSAEGRDYGQARKWMAEDVNAVIEGLLEAGVTEIVVNDSHGSMRNILPTDLHPAAALISGSPKPLSMMQGIDKTFDACIFIGYHARAGTTASILDHTYSGGSIHSIKVNGVELPELGLNAGIAGHFGVPVIMLSGDTETCRQAKELLGDEVTTVAVKEGITRFAARLVPFDKARQALKAGAKSAVQNRAKAKIYKPGPPFEFEVSFLKSDQADSAGLIPKVKRTGARTVVIEAEDFLEGFKIARALIALSSS